MIFAEQKVQERVPGKTKGAFLLAGWQSKKALFSFFRLFGYNQFLVIWGLRPRTNSGQVSWLKAQHPPPPSRNIRSSDRCSCTLAVNSLITVTRSCGICTRFPFNVPAAAKRLRRNAPAVFVQFAEKYSTVPVKTQEQHKTSPRPSTKFMQDRGLVVLEQDTGLEPAAYCLGSSRSTG